MEVILIKDIENLGYANTSLRFTLPHPGKRCISTSFPSAASFRSKSLPPIVHFSTQM